MTTASEYFLPSETVLECLFTDALELLRQLIARPSFSGEEDETAVLITSFFQKNGIPVQRSGHNVWALNRHFSAEKPTIVLNSHHDTVRPNPGYTRDPFSPDIENGILYGLGSNDAGGCLVSLIAAFVWFYPKKDLPFNLLIAATAEEENSGPNGLESLLPLLPPFDCAIVGEPTQTQLAVAEKGLLVLDCTAYGRAGHAARNEGQNALYTALQDVVWFRRHEFPKQSPWLGPIKMTVTSIETPNRAHNVVPDRCHFIVDVRLTDAYSPEEVLAVIQANVRSEAKPRSTRLRATAIAESHPLVQAGLAIGKQPYGSPTTSDKALMPVPALKMGPGDSARSHTADEYILLDEIRRGIASYIALLAGVRFFNH